MIQVGFKTDRGIKRRNNEDAFFVMPGDGIFIVADGVGGNNAGEIASRTVCNYIKDYVSNNPLNDISDEAELRRYFTDCVVGANALIFEMSHKHIENIGMATTLVVVYYNEKDGNAYVINVGDSRAYLFRDGEMTQLTVDHTYVNELLKTGSITEEEALHHEKRHVITRAVGGEEVIFPDFFRIAVKEGDAFLLCTDGLHGEVSSEEMAYILDSSETMSEACNKLVKKANQHGGNDNITIVCFRV